MYLEDVDLGKRASDLGMSDVCPHSTIGMSVELEWQ
jgi:hypothetical protein